MKYETRLDEMLLRILSYRDHLRYIIFAYSFEDEIKIPVDDETLPSLLEFIDEIAMLLVEQDEISLPDMGDLYSLLATYTDVKSNDDKSFWES